MITKIVIDSVASFKNAATLETDKRVNLIYGLNGSGKSTLSNFLADPKNGDYDKCAITGLDEETVALVYSQKFIEDNFYSTDEQRGIFTLSKRNAEAEKAIATLQKDRVNIEKTVSEIKDKILGVETEIESSLTELKDKVWEIKTQYSGGDRVLEYCFDGLKKKENLFIHINSTPRPSTAPHDTIELLKIEIESVSGDSATTLSEIESVVYSDAHICSDQIWSKVIVGNQSSTLSEVIAKLGNSDWVKTGQTYINQKSDKTQTCPFCQSQTITPEFIENLKSLFDASYESDTRRISDLASEYSQLISSTNHLDQLPSNEIYHEKFLQLKSELDKFKLMLDGNKKLISQKTNSPSSNIEIASLDSSCKKINELISEINESIRQHNKKIEDRAGTLSDIKARFWTLMRWNYDGPISASHALTTKKLDSKASLEASLSKARSDLQSILNKIREEQNKTINISEAVERIKNGLLDLGIDGFTIENHRENLYKISRPGGSNKTFLSLSEGEKMIISFLYFIEMCRGIKDPNDNPKKKVVVIDDPISSLSHIYVFNISQLIKAHFTMENKDFDQVFILTHSLYFFYDLTYTKKVDRDEHQALFRIIKNSNGSSIEKMGYTEIQNDYQSYWQVIKDPTHSPALIANCMRNVIEYFFSFVEKYELSNVFQKEPLNENKFQAFYRYINRESHSLGQNIFDIKEFDYDLFKEAFRLVFVKTGYEEHYKKMIK